MGTPAWDAALAAAEAAAITMRPLTSLDDADAVLRVMIATWGQHQLLPREMIVALSESGNVPYGAFDEDALMVGYVLGWAAIEPQDGLHVHSHMLAALPDRRHTGVGYALKLAQRAQCLDQGIHLVRWTFDPLIARNAWFNLGKLGAVADRFQRDFYGEMGDSLNAGERSDRLVVRWELLEEPGPRPTPADVVVVPIPGDYASLRLTDPSEGPRWRNVVAGRFEDLFSREMVAVAFERETSSYVFAPSDGRRT